MNVSAYSGTYAGGLRASGPSGSLLVQNTIIAGNHQVGDSDSDIVAPSSAVFNSGNSHNLIGYDPGALFTGSYNIVGVSSRIDARLAPLDYYGGRTKTHALLYDSQAIDAGDDDAVGDFDLAFDQREPDFDRLVGNHVDIGAFELALGEIYGV